MSANGKENANGSVNVPNGNASASDVREKGKGKEKNNAREKGGNAKKRKRGNSRRQLNESERGEIRIAVRWKDARWSARDYFTKIGNMWSFLEIVRRSGTARRPWIPEKYA